MSTLFTIHHDARRLADSIIEQHHKHLKHARILYVASTGTTTKGGKEVLAKTTKLSGLPRWLTDYQEERGEPYDFVITFYADAWSRLTPEQQIALVDHELCHIVEGEEDLDGNPTFRLVGHDVEEFSEIIQRHGLWMPDLKVMADAIQQRRLPGT